MEAKEFRFVKDPDSRWYIDLPSWEGDRSALEMVQNADIMLDILDVNKDNNGIVNLTLSDSHFDGWSFILEFQRDEAEGGVYTLIHPMIKPFDMWLCKVTKFVFGELPTKIYCS